MFQFTYASNPLKCNAILMRPKIIRKKNNKKENCFEKTKVEIVFDHFRVPDFILYQSLFLQNKICFLRVF